MQNTEFFDSTRKRNQKLAAVAGAGGAAALTVAVGAEPANASITEVSDTVTALGGIAGAAATIVIGAMGVRLAIKQVNRVMTKG